jgi:hypothetical protein
LSNVVAVAAGGFHSLALLKNSTVVAWGDNAYGETNIPIGLSNVVAIAAGTYHSLALKSDGTVMAWGANNANQTNVPVDLSNVVAIAAGGLGVDGFNLALQSSGSVVEWGYNGQASVPYGLSDVVAVAAGADHCLALQNNGIVVGWGDDSSGEASTPVGLSNIVAIAAGGEDSLALAYDPPPRPVNDNFANAIQINGSSATVYGSNINATSEPGEYDQGFPPASVWWTWTPSADGTVTLDASGGTVQPYLEIFTGNNVANLTLKGYGFGYASFPVFAGTPYYIDANANSYGYGPLEGDFALSLSECITPKIIDINFAGQTTETNGVHVLFCADVTGTVTSYDWSLTNTVQALSATPEGSCYEVVVSPTNTADIQVTLNVVSPCGSPSDGSSTVATCGICLSRGTPDLLTGTTGAGGGPMMNTPCGQLGANAQWYKMIPVNGNGLVTVSSQGSTTPTLLTIFDGPLNSLTNVTCSQGINTSNRQSLVSFKATQGTVYWIAMDPGTNTSANLSIASGFAPYIASFALTNGVFQLQSSVAPPIAYTLLATTNLSLNSSNWSVVLTTNLSTASPVLYYQETNVQKFPRRFYQLAPAP